MTITPRSRFQPKTTCAGAVSYTHLPPPPSPDAYVAFNYKNGGKEQGLIVYERYLKNTNEIDKRFNSIYNEMCIRDSRNPYN